LERQQQKFCNELKEMFMLHLDFKGIREKYSLTRNDFAITMTPPSEYKKQMEQMLRETQLSNFSTLSNDPAFSKSYLMRKYLNMNDDDIKANAKGFAEDKKTIPEDQGGY
jgi:hypothetical protein